MASKVPEEDDMEKRVAKLKRLRAGKKGSITKRITQLARLVSEGGSRSKIYYLYAALLEIHKATKILCEEISELTDDDRADADWIEDVTLNVDTCVAEVNAYLASGSVTESWIQAHALQTEMPHVNMDELTTQLRRLSAKDIPVLNADGAYRQF